MTTSNPLTKIGRQHDRTWCRLQKDCRIILSITLKLCQKILLVSLSTKPPVSKVASVISCQRCSPLFPIFSAINHGHTKPMAIENTLQADVTGCLLDRTTSSGLVKHLSKNGMAFIVSSEVSDVLNKLLKSDEETCSGDTMVLCKLFSGERISYNYATENAREIDANTPFSILGCTQMPNAARLVARMDKGQGLLDRFLISVPYARCPKSSEIQESIGYLATEYTC